MHQHFYFSRNITFNISLVRVLAFIFIFIFRSNLTLFKLSFLLTFQLFLNIFIVNDPVTSKNVIMFA